MTFFGGTNVCVGGSVKAIVDGHEVEAVITGVTPPIDVALRLRFPTARRFKVPAVVDGYRTYTFGDHRFRITDRMPIVEPLLWMPPLHDHVRPLRQLTPVAAVAIGDRARVALS